MIRAIIIEDEESGLRNLKNLLARYCQDVSVIGDAGSIEDGLKLLSDSSIKPDVAFLDINLSDGLVFQLLAQIPNRNFEIIFVTGYDKFAIKACDYSSIGYILKPIDPDDLIAAVKRIKPKSTGHVSQRIDIFNKAYSNPNSFRKISVSAIDGIYFISIAEIIRMEAEDNYTHIWMEDGSRIVASKTIKFYEDLMNSFNFYRTHKKHLINLNHIKKIARGDGGYVLMDDSSEIEISRRRRSSFIKRIKGLQGGS